MVLQHYPKILFQFALPRGERRSCGRLSRMTSQVSIRAPAWGATPKEGQGADFGMVSIRAPAWGATCVH